MRWLVGAVVLASTACFASYGLHESAVAHNREGIERLGEGDLEGAAAAFRLAVQISHCVSIFRYPALGGASL